MGREEDREGEEREKRVGCEDEGGKKEGVSDPSGRVTGEEEECRVEGKKQAEEPQGETERRKCCVQVK